MQPIIQKIALTLLGGFIAAAGGIIVALYADSLTRKRERKAAISANRRVFVASMESWKWEIGREFMPKGGGGGREHHESAFKDRISTFIIEAGLIKHDLTAAERIDFEALCKTLIGWKHKSIYDPADNEKAQKEMSDIIAFVEKTGF